MSEPNMPDLDKTGSENCQAARLLASRVSRFVISCALPPLLLLAADGLTAPYLFAAASNAVSASLRTEDHVHVTARRAGDTLLVTLRIDPGYHVNANPASNEYLIPTSVAFSGSEPERVVYPPAIAFKPAFADEPIGVYEGTVVVAVTFPGGALDRAPDLGFTVTAQACTKEICLPPDDISGHATW